MAGVCSQKKEIQHFKKTASYEKNMCGNTQRTNLDPKLAHCYRLLPPSVGRQPGSHTHTCSSPTPSTAPCRSLWQAGMIISTEELMWPSKSEGNVSSGSVGSATGNFGPDLHVFLQVGQRLQVFLGTSCHHFLQLDVHLAQALLVQPVQHRKKTKGHINLSRSPSQW